jgi:hypothetical protein
MTDLIYIIEKIWTDSMENQFERALGYSPIGFVSDEKKAIDYCSKGCDYTSKDCWAIGILKKDEKLPEYKYVALKKLE